MKIRVLSHNSTAKLFFLNCNLVVLIFFLSFCNSSNRIVKDVEAIRYIVQFPLINENKELTYTLDTINVFYYEKHFFYELPYEEISMESSNTILTKKKYVFARNDTSFYGYLCHQLNDSVASIRYAADSFLRQRAFKSDLSLIADSMILSSSQAKRAIIIEKYIFSKVTPAEGFDTAILYYDKRLSKIKYSLAPKLDSIKNSKICKAEFKFNTKYSVESDFEFPERILSYEIQNIKVDVPKPVEVFIKNYVKRAKN